MKNLTLKYILPTCLVFVLLPVIGFGLGPQPQSKSADEVGQINEIHVDAKGCYGDCPAYEVTLSRGREITVTYLGKRSVNHTGKYRGTIPEGDFNMLAKFIEGEGLFQMSEEYARGTFDAYVVSISVTGTRGKKTVTTFNLGPEPTQLWGIEKAVRGVIAEMKWEKDVER